MAHGATARERTVCNHCGLPFYSDSGGCPYCESAGKDAAAPAESTGETTRPTADGSDTERSGLLTRLKQALGM